MHPSYEVDREYAVRVFGEVTNDMLSTMKRGVQLEDGPAKFTDIVREVTPDDGDEEQRLNQWFKVWFDGRP